MNRIFALLLLFAANCSGSPADPGSASDPLETSRLAGLYQSDGPRSNGDIIHLQLTADGRFAWTRCYAEPCDAPLREVGTYELARGNIYFLQTGKSGDTATYVNSSYRVRSGPRRATLWLDGQVLAAVAEADLCRSSKGTWSEAMRVCDCGAGWPTAYGPGAGGCWLSPATTETSCDATLGRWTDDDATLVGTYCECGIGRHLTEGGCADNH